MTSHASFSYPNETAIRTTLRVGTLKRAVTPFILSTLEQQIALGGRRDRAIVFGTGENFKFLERLNRAHGLFDSLEAVDHPRFIMQYRRKKLDQYLARYAEVFSRALAPLTPLAVAGSS